LAHVFVLTQHTYAYVCQTVRWVLGNFLLRLWKGAGSASYKLLCTFSSDQTTAWKEMPVGVLVVGAGPGGLVLGNIVLGGQPQIEEGHSPWSKYCIKWGRWKAGVENQEWKMRHDMTGRSRTVCHLCNMLQWIKRLVSGHRDY